MARDDVVITASAGHGEYGPHPYVQVETIWDGMSAPPVEEAFAASGEVKVDWERLDGLAREATGLDVESWEVVERLTGSLRDHDRALDGLVAAISEPPSGDDTTYDYWPSGVRYAFEWAGALDAIDGRNRRERVVRAARSVLESIDLSASDLNLPEEVSA